MAQIVPKAFLMAGTKPLRGDMKNVAHVDELGVFPDKTKTTARIDMSADVAGAGLCPECKKPMKASHANGIPGLMCADHRIFIPKKDDEPEQTAE